MKNTKWEEFTSNRTSRHRGPAASCLRPLSGPGPPLRCRLEGDVGGGGGSGGSTITSLPSLSLSLFFSLGPGHRGRGRSSCRGGFGGRRLPSSLLWRHCMFCFGSL